MQKGAKRIKTCKSQKPYCQEHVDRLERPEENMSTSLVQAAAARSAQAMRAGCTVHSASTSRLDHEVVDWIMQPVDWMKLPWKN